MTYDFRRRHHASAAALHSLVQKYMTMLGLDIAPAVKIRNSIGARALGTCSWRPGQPTSTISVQKSVTVDAATLERIFAHEMAHHAVFLENIKELKRIADERGPHAGPYVQMYLRNIRRDEAHGVDWLRYVKVINAHMGSGFVTPTSDETYVASAETKPYFVLIAKLPTGSYGYQIGVNLSPKMKQRAEAAIRIWGAKLIRTTDARWQHGPRIGSPNWATSSDKQDEMRRLHSA